MRKIKLTIRIGRDPLVKEYKVSAYMTSVAGLVVHPEVEYDTVDDKFIIKRNSWAITQYPTGALVFGKIFTMTEAFDIVVQDMAAFNWVGLTAEDAMVPNDPQALQAMARTVNEKIKKDRQLQQQARSK